MDSETAPDSGSKDANPSSSTASGQDTTPGKAVPPVRVAPSRNQKQRSKLKQPTDHSPPAPAPAPVAAPIPPPPAPAEPPRKFRLKRSGHMHEQFAEIPDEPPRKQDTY